MDKETPKKLISDGCGDLYCPRCKCWITEYHQDGIIDGLMQNYCSNCGQRLDWSVEEK